VAFDPGSVRLRIERCAFSPCSSLSSICIPSSVEVLCDGCLSGLSSVTFEPGSRLSALPTNGGAL
jgi:hypothetical protein